jgi:lipid-binding SYLF domain-containing protein
MLTRFPVAAIWERFADSNGRTLSMMPTLRILAILASLLLLPAVPALAQVDQAQTVSRSLATLERMKADQNFQKSYQAELTKARGVLIIPSLYRGGFLIGGQYGDGVLLAHKADGSWSYPAFYTMSGGSLGLQIGIESSAILFIIRTDKGLNAVLNNQFKFGAEAGITFVTAGAGVGASTTSAFGADIVAFAMSGVGLYGGLSLEGTVLSPRESWNSAYYHQNVATRAIVEDSAASNPQADKLRDVLAH